jgi:NitT/TauT family transport system ATP-binding protein
LDEPFVALDMLLRQEMNDLVLALWQETRPTVLFVTHELNEAVYLADRVVVMSPRPGHIVGSVPITLPRPRRPEMRYGPDLTSTVQKLWRMMEERRVKSAE